MSVAISTGVGLAVVGAGLGASAAKDIYGTHSANKTNKRAQDLQGTADTRAADLAAAELAQHKTEAEFKQKQDTQRWQDYLRVNEPMWQGGANVLQSLYGLAGLRGGAPGPTMPGGATPPPPSAGVSYGDGPPSAPPPVAGASSTRPTLSSYAPQPTAGPKGMTLADLMQLATQSGSGKAPWVDMPSASAGQMA